MQQAMAGLQIGYADGDYFILRLVERLPKGQFLSPTDAFVMIDHIEHAGARPVFTRIYLDSELQKISEKILPYDGYDPRTRPWYLQALNHNGPSRTEPFLFYFMRQIGVVITHPLPGKQAVIAADVTLKHLSETLAAEQYTTSSEIVVIDSEGKVLAYTDTDRTVRESNDHKVSMFHITEMGIPIFEWFDSNKKLAPQQLQIDHKGEQWTGSVKSIPGANGANLRIIVIAPNHELFAEAYAIRWDSAKITLLILLLAIPLAWLLAKQISNPLKRLAKHASAVSKMDFSDKLYIRSVIKEIDDLFNATHTMSDTISRFLGLIDSLAREKDLAALQERILKETSEVAHAKGTLLYLLDEKELFLKPSSFYLDGKFAEYDFPNISIDDVDSPIISALNADKAKETMAPEGNQLVEKFRTVLACETIKLTLIPLKDRQKNHFGVLVLLYPASKLEEMSSDLNQLDFIQALSGFAAVSLESKQLLAMQKQLLDSFIKLIAGAIDAKSPYTGGHCQRVPELTRMICEAANQSDETEFREFHLSEDDWEALDIASWLHDCGKVTTPEYVVDKSTKLETLYDRIHEIRMRFEVLKRDAQLQYWIALDQGGDKDKLSKQRDQALRSLDEDFEFIAQCNEGGEYMSEESLERLSVIAQRTWQRTLNDRIGISWEEQQRKQSGEETLPITEKLLADKTEHIIGRSASDRIQENNSHGFKVDTPEHKYNRGELYNLSVAKGTLNNEERYMINDHIVQTIIMLNKLPFPKHLREVPEIAGGHHEKMDGTGYPKRLTGKELSISAKAMAIADIFEALTAADRPYKTPKSLNESIKIMSFMARDQHIDPDLFELFLRQGIHERYAKTYLDKKQIDRVDINQYLR
ncbi:hypothetical protein MIB92_14610 [Aestuariirhabdus sp. Z084]|nr:HD domain-containing phosphohydrolase [Aestuariirhabdus haliotis]MCL6416890.1 hypothetical protein [Aestuariirhabdus haliotis]